MTERDDANGSGSRRSRCPCLVYSMDLTVLNLAVPALSADLQPRARELLWIVDIYGFLVAGALITMGTLGDRIGRRRAAACSARRRSASPRCSRRSRPAPAMLIVARALLGIAGATLAPSTLSLIRRCSRTRASARRVGVWIASFSGGAAIGPLVGGALLEHFWWGSVFLLDVPVMVLLLLRRPAAAAGVPRPGRRAAGPAQRGAVARRGAGRDLRPQDVAAEGPARRRRWRGSLAGARARRRVRAPPARLAHPLIDLGLFRCPAFAARWRRNSLGLFVDLRRCRCSSRSTCSRCSGSRRWRPGCGRCPRRSASSPARC